MAGVKIRKRPKSADSPSSSAAHQAEAKVSGERLEQPAPHTEEEEAVLQRSIQLQELDSDVFLAPKANLWQPFGARGVFGGQIIGQTLQAAILSVPPSMEVDSFHGYFMLAMDAERDVVLHVKRVRDGGSFATRMVEARQQGKAIFMASLQFHSPEPSQGLEVAQAMPVVPGPEGLRSDREILQEMVDNPNLTKWMRAFYLEGLERPARAERRVVPAPEGADPHEPVEYFWAQANGRLSNDRNIHLVSLAYMSDMGMFTCAYRPFGGIQRNQPTMLVSLDHAMWFHSPDGFRADDWLLFEVRCVRAGGARVSSFMKVWTQQGNLIFSASSEGLARHAEPLQRLPASAGGTAKL